MPQHYTTENSTAKLFMNGKSQAVRLPAEFRFEGDEVFVRRDPQTNEVILSPKPKDWDSFFQLADSVGIPDDFLNDRDASAPRERDLFGDDCK